ncbi:MAG: carboxypeptidase regulatory-like domain-containing protein [Vicinamibacterales bacterium]
MRTVKNHLLAWTLSVCAMLTLANPAFAQSGPTGTLNGRVLDQSHAGVPGVTVTAANVARNDTRHAVTNADGFYALPGLATGTYELTIQLEGFKTVRRLGVLVEAAVPRTVDITLEVGGLSEVVTVEAAMPMVNRTTPAVSRRLSGAEITAVPSSTRNFSHLLTATAGVSADLPPVGGNDTGSISPSVNGTKTTSNSVLYNGVDITSMLSNQGTLDEGLVPAPEMIEEVKLQTSLYDASTGRSGGGNFQLVTRSGVNAFRTSLYAFGQHESLNSNDYFFDRNGIDKPKMRRVETGLTIGGPVRRDKVFFFGSLQYSDAESGYVPTASSRAVLPAALGLISGDRTAENIVAAFRQLNPSFNLTPSQISPISLALLNQRNPVTGGYLIPAPTGAAAGADRRATIGAFGSIGGDPLAEHRQVVPALFEQLQGSLRADLAATDANRVQLTYFASDFPSLDPFPDPSTLASPFTLRRSNRGQVGSIGDTQVFGNGILNEARAGFFTLRNTRQLDDEFLALTNEMFGIVNPALQFDDRDATRRLGHFVNRAITWSFGGPNDAFNRRDQQTLHLSDAMTLVRGNHTLQFGGDVKRHRVRNNLPEEQATEFEKIENFQQFLLGFTSEADTQYGFTEKQFQFYDADLFITDSWRVSPQLTVTAGVRWDWFGWPVEADGFMGNFDPSRITDTSGVLAGIVVPSHAGNTGIPQIDAAIAAAPRAGTKHTLAGEDLDNIAPRLGFAWTPGRSSRSVIRGGYGIFYDRISAAFMNTIFSNYPHLREAEIVRPSAQVPFANAWGQQRISGEVPNFNQWFPFFIRYSPSSGSYGLFDSTGVPAGNPAETLEFRAIDKDLETPYYHQWNLGYQFEITQNMAIELRYNASRGRDLLLATALNEPWDLNDPNVPQVILDRITAAYRAGGGTATAQDPNALGYGYNGDRNRGPAGTISTEIRTLYLGMNDAEALYLQSKGRSSYNAFQASLTKRMSNGYQFHAAYTFSRAMDLMSADPGSTAGGGRPDTPNTGFSVENDSRDLESNWARADFDRPHRFSLSAIWELPLGQNAFLRDWQLATFMQFQSGRPFSVFRPEAGLLRLGFQRLDFAPGASAESAARQGSDETQWFDVTQLVAAAATGNTPRNFLRGPAQRRVDMSVTKGMPLGSRMRAEMRFEVFNVFNTVNFGLPENNFDSSDFGNITTTIGGPRVSQFGVRIIF